jgi:hypothetical protein
LTEGRYRSRTEKAYADMRERPAASDHGVVMYRNMVIREIEKVRQNLDPMNVIRDPDHPIIDTKLDESIRAEKAGSTAYHLPSTV